MTCLSNWKKRILLICNTLKVETIQISINSWMYMQLMGISLQWNTIQKKKRKEKWATDIHYSMDKAHNNYPEWKKSDQKSLQYMITFV